MMTENGRPCRRISSGSSAATRSCAADLSPPRMRVMSTERKVSAIRELYWAERAGTAGKAGPVGLSLPADYNTPMPAAASFDITSEIDFQEVDNALNQARKEVGQRYDFKGATAEITLNATEKTLTLLTDDEMKMNALWEIVQTRLVRRGVPVKNFKADKSEAAASGKMRRVIPIQQGIPIEAAKEIIKFIKDAKLKKVQATIQADQVRVSSPSKDELQTAMHVLREHDFGVALQFGNYR